MDGEKDYFADRQESRPELRDARIAPDEARACQIVVPTKSRMGEHIPDYDPAVSSTRTSFPMRTRETSHRAPLSRTG